MKASAAPQVEFPKSSKTPFVPSLEAIELLLWPLSKKDRLKAHFAGRGAAVSKQLDAKAFAYLGESESLKKTKTTERFELHYSEGGSAHVLLVADKLSRFEFHTALRKCFGPTFASRTLKSTVVFDVRSLGVSLQTWALEALGVLAVSASWKPTGFGKKASQSNAQNQLQLQTLSTLDSRKARAVVEAGFVRGRAYNQVRTLADLPANELNPKNYRKWAQDFAKDHGLKFEYSDVAALKKLGAGAFLAVNQADPDSHAGIARIKYTAKGGGKKRKKLILVGKGLCFDTGGYNIKTGNFMYGMQRDMTGSAVAAATVGAMAELGVDYDVEAWLAIAENLISPTAYKPNEVVIACDGTSIEVIDTDAEGRMVLSDTLALAAREKPDLILDFATLTGAAIRALGTKQACVFSNHDKLLKLAVDCGASSGERTWGFPCGADYFDNIKSDIADLRQCSDLNHADHIYAATFLSHFVGETPWIHMDLTASNNASGLGLLASNTTGFGPSWAIEVANAHLSVKGRKN